MGPNSDSSNDGYLWDLYKLLQVPSPVRVFIARHAQVGHPELQRRIADVVLAYAPRYSTDDRIFSVLFPTARFAPTDEHAYPVQGWVRARGSRLRPV